MTNKKKIWRKGKYIIIYAMDNNLQLVIGSKQFKYNTTYKVVNLCHMKKASSLAIVVNDMSPMLKDRRDHDMLPHINLKQK